MARTHVAVGIDEYNTIMVYSSMAAADRHLRPNYPIVKRVKNRQGEVVSHSYYDSAADADAGQHGINVSMYFVRN